LLGLKEKGRFSYIYSWFTYAKNIVSEIGFDIESTEKCQTIKEVKQYKHIIKDSSNYYNKNIILNKIKNSNRNNKTYLYKFLKNPSLSSILLK
jgi:hypothetical protein